MTAVDVDPPILELGRAMNPTRPYADPRVQGVNDDARHFIQSTEKTFDLVVGTLDSQSLLSSQTVDGHVEVAFSEHLADEEAALALDVRLGVLDLLGL